MVSASVHVINPVSVQERAVRRGERLHAGVADRRRTSHRQHHAERAGQQPEDFFALVRKDPQKYTFGTTSIGSASHLAIELLKSDAGLDTLVVAYKGTRRSPTSWRADPSACRSDAVLAAPRTRRKIKALGLTSLKGDGGTGVRPSRSGVKGFHFVSWYGLWGRRTYQPIFPTSCRATSPRCWRCPTSSSA